jgi:hypothetical protein
MIVGVFIKWSDAVNALGAFGAHPIPYDRMLDYWMRMFSGAFALVGCWYLLLMIWPRKFASAIPWFGGLMLIEGCIVLVHGVRLSLPPFPFYADTAACFVSGIGILYFARSAVRAPHEASGSSSSPPPERAPADP